MCCQFFWHEDFISFYWLEICLKFALLPNIFILLTKSANSTIKGMKLTIFCKKEWEPCWKAK